MDALKVDVGRVDQRSGRLQVLSHSQRIILIIIDYTLLVIPAAPGQLLGQLLPHSLLQPRASLALTQVWRGLDNSDSRICIVPVNFSPAFDGMYEASCARTQSCFRTGASRTRRSKPLSSRPEGRLAKAGIGVVDGKRLCACRDRLCNFANSESLETIELQRQ